MSIYSSFLERNRKTRELWRTMPNSSVMLVLAFAFCLFAAVGALSQLAGSPAPLATAWLLPLLTGAFAAVMVWTIVRANPWWFPVVVAVFLSSIGWIQHYTRSSPGPRVSLPGNIQNWLTFSSIFTIVLISLAWALALQFINREGQRLFRVQTEMRLAGEIHSALVPAIQRRIGDFEFYGISQPSGMVGGDLVDVLSYGSRWLAYVADVSGHGVSSGVVMAMMKSSMHTASQHQAEPQSLLPEVNRFLCELRMTNMFITCGLLTYSPEQGLQYVLAGHPPILRLRGKTMETLSESSLPLGILPNGAFQAVSFEMQKGDALVIVTDGFTEATTSDGEELGFSSISRALQDGADLPIQEMADRILNTVDGLARNDDQTLLIVRRVA